MYNVDWFVFTNPQILYDLAHVQALKLCALAKKQLHQ